MTSPVPATRTVKTFRVDGWVGQIKDRVLRCLDGIVRLTGWGARSLRDGVNQHEFVDATPSPYRGHRFPVGIISHCVWLCYRFPLSFREVEEMVLARGVVVSHETIRQWCRTFGQTYANGLRRRRPGPGDKWHLIEQYANNPIEADQGRFKARLRPIRGLKRLRSARVISTGHAFVQNIRRGHHELGVDMDPRSRLPAAFTELIRAI